MRKSELIALLSGIEGDPEIMLADENRVQHIDLIATLRHTVAGWFTRNPRAEGRAVAIMSPASFTRDLEVIEIHGGPNKEYGTWEQARAERQARQT